MVNMFLRKFVLGKKIYVIIDEVGDEICILQPFEFSDGYIRQLKIWMNKDKGKILEHDTGEIK